MDDYRNDQDDCNHVVLYRLFASAAIHHQTDRVYDDLGNDYDDDVVVETDDDDDDDGMEFRVHDDCEIVP